MTADRGATVLDALRQERALYARILDLAVRQRREAEAGRTEELLAVLAEKGRLTEEVARAGQGSRQFKTDWAAASARMDPRDAEIGKRLLDEMAGILRSILAEEEACQKLLGRSRDGALEELLRVQKGRRAAQAYGQRPAAGPRFKDEKK